jgi:hypothetical protein
MCSVSAVSDYYTRDWQLRPNTIPVQQFDLETKVLLLRAIEILDRIDKRLGDRECMDKSKEEFMKDLTT